MRFISFNCSAKNLLFFYLNRVGVRHDIKKWYFLHLSQWASSKLFSIFIHIYNNKITLYYSGLDIVAIKQCITLLVDLARQGRTVVCTIHQPSSSLFHMFDHVYMLARGSCIYNGTPRQLVPFLTQVGHVCKPTHNPADYGKCGYFSCGP